MHFAHAVLGLQTDDCTGYVILLNDILKSSSDRNGQFSPQILIPKIPGFNHQNPGFWDPGIISLITAHFVQIKVKKA